MENSDYPLVIKAGLLENHYFLTIFAVRNIYIYIDDFTQFSCDFPVFFPLKPPFTSHVPASHMGLSENRVPLNPFTTIFPIKQLFLMGIPTFRQTMVDIGGLPP